MNRMKGFGPDIGLAVYSNNADADTQWIARRVINVVEHWQRVRQMLRWAYNEALGTVDFEVMTLILLNEGFDKIIEDAATMHHLVETTVVWGRRQFGHPQT